MSNCKTIAICNQKGGVGKTTREVLADGRQKERLRSVNEKSR